MPRLTKRTLIRDATIITMEGPDSLIPCGHIHIADDTIVAVTKEAPLATGFDLIIDGRNKLALPGFVNGHTHVGMTPLRGYADDLPLQTWLFDHIIPVEERLGGEDVYWATMLAIAEMIRSGTTCFADMYFFMDEVARAVAATGVRADLSRGLQCFEDHFDPENDARLNETKDLIRTWHQEADGRIQVRVAPHSVYLCPPAYLEATHKVAVEHNVGLHIHLSETRKENADCLAAYGVSPTHHLERLGLLGANTIAAHGVHLSHDDMDRLSRSGTTVVLNAGSNLKLGSGVPSLGTLMEKGVPIALGTDGVASNNNLDMLQEAYLTAVLYKGVSEDPSCVTAYEALELATLRGAQALGLGQRVGQVRAGMKADVILIDLDKPHYCPLHDPIAALVYAGQSSDVDTVMVDGQVLLREGELTTIDIAEVKHQMKAVCRRLFG